MAYARLASDEARLRRRIALNVRRIRAARALSAIAASESVGMHWRMWQKIEGGETNVTLRNLARVAKALRVDVRELFE